MSSSEVNNGIFSAEDLMEETASREDVELERSPSEEPGWFAPWFKVIDPNKKIHENEYFWRNGQPLEADNWTDDASLDRYLGLNESDNEAVVDEEYDENETGFPLTLSLDLSDDDDEYDYDVVEIIRDDESVSSTEMDYSLVAPPLDRGVSDWTKMPALLPKLQSAELEPKELTREPSDWSKMPSVLPPLNTILETPEMQKELSNWEVMPPLMAPLPSDPSQYHHVPNVMPMAPQISWEPSGPQTVATPTWLQQNTAPSVGMDYVASNGASQREMEILSPHPIMTAPVLYNGYGYTPVQQTGTMAAPFIPTQPALVHFPFITLVGSII